MIDLYEKRYKNLLSVSILASNFFVNACADLRTRGHISSLYCQGKCAIIKTAKILHKIFVIIMHGTRPCFFACILFRPY